MTVMPRVPDLVTVVIPCYNQGHFLGEAVESALGQSYHSVEVMVVDDGSTDRTSEVAAGYEGIRCVRQANQGLSAARNAGLRESRGDYIVFLDADDRLRPGAVEAGVNALRDHAECACAHGHYVNIAADGSLQNVPDPACTRGDQYAALLRGNYICMPATVIYRRSVFDDLGGFDAAFPGCEDYDMYLRIARKFPIHCHHALVAEYRHHGENMSRDPTLMLASALKVLGAQAKYARRKGEYKEALEQGVRGWQYNYGERLVIQARSRVLSGDLRQAALGLSTLLRLYPRGLVTAARDKLRNVITNGIVASRK